MKKLTKNRLFYLTKYLNEEQQNKKEAIALKNTLRKLQVYFSLAVILYQAFQLVKSLQRQTNDN